MFEATVELACSGPIVEVVLEAVGVVANLVHASTTVEEAHRSASARQYPASASPACPCPLDPPRRGDTTNDPVFSVAAACRGQNRAAAATGSPNAYVASLSRTSYRLATC